MTVAYKVLDPKQEPWHGGTGRWVKKRWRTVDGPLEPCRNGIHYCRPDQLTDWLGPTIWLFEDGSPDETVDAGDKMVTRRGRILEQVTGWNETTARLFAADCAEAVLPIFERECPDDDRPRKAIEAARLYARGEIGAAARAARAAASAAGDAARDAASAAASAAGDVARDAAWAAASAAGDAAWAAWDAARDAAWAAARDAAWAAARDAASAAGDVARDAAWDAAWAAWDAARAEQTVLLMDYLEGRRT